MQLARLTDDSKGSSCRDSGSDWVRGGGGVRNSTMRYVNAHETKKGKVCGSQNAVHPIKDTDIK